MGKRRKEEREAAVAAELRRRVEAAGVPEERHVYVMGRHHGDEGGPRTFYPVLLSRSLRVATVEERVALQEELVRQVAEGGAVEVKAEEARHFVPFASYADFSWVQHPEFLILSRRAAELLHDLLMPCGRFFPIVCEGAELEGFVLEAVDEVLDLPNCLTRWGTFKGAMHEITSYAFQTELLGRHSMFRVGATREIFVVKRFVDLCLKEGLGGVRFGLVWPRISTSSAWWSRKEWLGAPIQRFEARGRRGGRGLDHEG